MPQETTTTKKTSRTSRRAGTRQTVQDVEALQMVDRRHNAALREKGYTSAFTIANTPRADFMATVGDTLGQLSRQPKCMWRLARRRTSSITC
jgi:hypothetical protein